VALPTRGSRAIEAMQDILIHAEKKEENASGEGTVRKSPGQSETTGGIWHAIVAERPDWGSCSVSICSRDLRERGNSCRWSIGTAGKASGKLHAV